jgi:hypothetical protein
MSGKLTADVILELGKKGIDSFIGWLDRNENEIDTNDFIDYFNALASLWGQSAQCDSPLTEEEETFIGSLINDCFIPSDKELCISQKMLEKIGFKKKQMKKLMFDSVHRPMILKDICRVADKLEEEEYFYFQACMVTLCDGELKEEEDQFLIDLAERFELTKLDRIRILQEAIDSFKGEDEED